MSRRLRIPSTSVETMRRLAGLGYPEEVCGVLVGEDAEGVRRIARVEPVHNQRDQGRERRYLIEAEALRRIESAVEREGLSVLGFYHSHPDHPAEPSAFDREHAWPWYSYVIVPVTGGEPGPLRAWRLLDDRAAFVEESIAIDPDGRQ